MSTTGQLQSLVSSLMVQIPTLVVCVVGFVILLSRGKNEVPGRTWGLLGFGIAAGLGIAIPLVQSIFPIAALAGGDPEKRMWILSSLSFFWSLLRAAAYACILAAVLARRPVTPPPLRTYVDD